MLLENNIRVSDLQVDCVFKCPTGSLCQINKVLSHPTLPITITAQEDRHIKFYDNNTGTTPLLSLPCQAASQNSHRRFADVSH